MRVLLYGQAVENQGQAEQLNVRVTERRVIAHQFLIHRVFDPRPDYRIQKIRSDEYGRPT